MPQTSRASKETYIALLAALGVAWYVIGRYLVHAAVSAYQWPLFVVLVIGGGPLIFDLLRKIAVAEFGSDLLAGLDSDVGLTGRIPAGSIVVLDAFRRRSAGTVRNPQGLGRTGALAKRMPRVAHRRKDPKLRR